MPMKYNSVCFQGRHVMRIGYFGNRSFFVKVRGGPLLGCALLPAELYLFVSREFF